MVSTDPRVMERPGNCCCGSGCSGGRGVFLTVLFLCIVDCLLGAGVSLVQGEAEVINDITDLEGYSEKVKRKDDVEGT